MLYDAYEMQRSLLAGASTLANFGAGWLNNPANPFAYSHMGPIVASALDVFAHASASRGKPDFGIESTIVGGRTVAVTEEIVLRKPFGQLKRFRREGMEGSPKLLMVAPMSGHYATLLRGTVERMLPGHDVYITDWRDAKLVPLDAGGFDLDDYIDYLIAFMEAIGPGAHMLAVCQPSVPAYAAAAVMSSAGHPCRPKTLTLMGGPIDTRKAPTAVNTLATQRPFAWFERNVVATVPYLYPGGGRKVYPGFLQLAGFMAMNLGEQALLRGISLGLRHDRRILPADRRSRVPAPFAAQRRDGAPRRPRRSRGDRGRRLARYRRRARRHFGRRPDQSGAHHLHRPAAQAEALPPRQGRRPLRHLPRHQMAHPNRPDRRGLDRPAR